MAKKLELYHLKDYTGYQRQFLTIQEAIKHPRESTVLNIIGAYGIGRSSILTYIKDQLENKVWVLPQSKDPFVAFIQGQSYDNNSDTFLGFLARELNVIIDSRFPEKTNTIVTEPEDLIHTVIEKLRWLANEDYPVLVMIDNFDRIMERLKTNEAQGLNRLRIGGLHYILVTDVRSIHEIAPRLAYLSDFFRTAQIVSFPPLNADDTQTLIRQVFSAMNEAYEKDYELSDNALSFIEKLAGGHSALVVKVVQHAFFDICKAPPTDKGCKITENDLIKETFLSFLPEDETINYYLERIISAISNVPLAFMEIEFLVNVAMGAETTKLKIPNKPRTLIRFRTMGFIRDTHDLEIDGLLIQYAILKNVIPQHFSETEQFVVDHFLKIRPGLVTFETLEELLQNFADNEGDKDVLRRFVDSTISRIRKKISTIPNNASLSIENVRGEGFYITSNISFELFCEKGPKAFSE